MVKLSEFLVPPSPWLTRFASECRVRDVSACERDWRDEQEKRDVPNRLLVRVAHV